MRNLKSALGLLVILTLLTGCASPWEKNFQPNPTLDQPGKYPPAQQVDVRVVEFERLTNYGSVNRSQLLTCLLRFHRLTELPLPA